MHPIELLSPAKDLETGVAAINCGADAVYAGASRFGAREAAGNDLADLEQLIRYAHRYWAKVYVTVNTLLFDSELEEARELVKTLYEMGADALIIQDVGLLEMDLPPIPLFASTQMHNHNPERVAFLERAGIQRAILARELSLAQVRDIRQKTTLELETFIHGALCVSYSGQCSMSYSLGGRSGNRGQCAQPCRKLYTLLDGQGKPVVKNRYLLSLRDLNLSAHLEELIDAGVCSFKIEGRLKDKTYVMNVVSHYRLLLDEILVRKGLTRGSSGLSSPDFIPDPRKSFNRGFTTYFLKDRGERVSSHLTPKSTGEPLGKITQTTAKSITLESSSPVLHPGDGICFFDSSGELKGTAVNQVIGNQIFLQNMDGITRGTQLFRNHDHQFTTQLQKSRVERKIRVKFNVVSEDSRLRLTAVDEDGVTAESELTADYPQADHPAAAAARVERQLRKLGGTDFLCTSIVIDPRFSCFIPAAELNYFRQQAIENLVRAREISRPRRQTRIGLTDHPFPETRLSYRGNVLNHLAAAFYRRHGVKEIEPAAESGLDLRGRIVMTTRYCLRYELGACLKQPGGKQLSEPLILIDEQGSRFPLAFNCRDCLMDIYLDSLPD